MGSTTQLGLQSQTTRLTERESNPSARRVSTGLSPSTAGRSRPLVRDGEPLDTYPKTTIRKLQTELQILGLSSAHFIRHY